MTCEPHCECSDNICRTTSDQVCVIVDGVKSAHMCGMLSDIPMVSAPPNADKASPAIVAAGVSTNVIVEGGAFANHKNLACLVNGTAVQTTWLSPTQISCLVDAAPGSYDLSVSDGYATGASTPIKSRRGSLWRRCRASHTPTILWRRRSLVLLIIPVLRVFSMVTQSRPISLTVRGSTVNLPLMRCGLPLHCQVHTALCHCAALDHWK